MFKYILALVLFIHSTAFAIPPLMPLSEVKEGMTGTAYTVIDSNGTIKNFSVKIVGTINNGKGNNTLIMARASGDLVQSTGGVLQGMSGSPVYVNGKLIGALSAGFQNMDPYTFLITPIENMLDIWNLPDTYNPNSHIKNFDENKDAEKNDENSKVDDAEKISVENADTEKNDEISNIDDDEKISADEKAVTIYSGFDSAGLNYLKNSLSDFGLKDFTIASSGGIPNIKYDAELFGGSAFGVAVVCGDFIVGATGTVTVTDDKKILGFGHSFTHGGNVNYFMTEANVIGAVPGIVGGMKIASAGSIIGRINQDRETGVGGIIGQFPAIVPINVTINNDDYNAIIAYNENLVPKLGAAIAYSALNKSVDSVSEGTVKVNFDIKTDAIDGGVLSRENLYYAPADVGQLAVSELLTALNLISSNTTSESNVFGIDVTMDFERARKTASLVKAESTKKLVKPGEEIKLKVTLQPYRQKEITLDVPYTVPLTAKEGAFVLDLHGGGLVPVTAVQQAGVVMPSTKSPKQVYDEKIQQLLKANKNNEIIIKPAAVVRTEKELKAEIKRMKKLAAVLQKRGIKPTAATPGKFSTDYVIDNVIQCTLNVDKL